MNSISIINNTIGRDLNIYLKNIDGVDGLQRINDYFLTHGSAKKVYTELIEYFTEAEGYFSKNIERVVDDVDVFLLDEWKKKDHKPTISNIDDIEGALADIKDIYKNENKKLAYINYLQGCLLQIRFNYVRAYHFLEESCRLDLNVKYYCATGELAIKLSRYSDAELYFRCVVNVLKDERCSRIEYIETLNNLGGSLDQQYKFEQAISYYHAAVYLQKEQNDSRESNLYLGLFYNNLGGAFLALSNYADAQKYLQLSLDIREKYLAKTNEIAITKNNLAEVFRLQKDMIKAKKLLEQARDSLKDRYIKYPNHPSIAQTLNNLGNLYLDLKKYKDAKISFELALGIWNEIFNSIGNQESIITLYNLAITCWHSHNYKDALNYFKQALNESNENLEETNPVCIVIKQDYNEFINQKKFKVFFLKYWFLNR